MKGSVVEILVLIGVDCISCKVVPGGVVGSGDVVESIVS